MDLKRFRNWMLGEGRAISTIEATIRYLKRLTIDLDTIEDKYKIAEWVFKQKCGDGSKNNFVKAINLYLRFKNIDYKLKAKRKKGDPDIWVPTKDEAHSLMTVELKRPFQTHRCRLLLKFIFIGGLRRDEVRNLQYSDVRSTPSKTVKGVYYYYLHVVGKGNKTRFVDIPKGLYEETRRYRQYYGGRTEYIFDNGRGAPITPTHVGRICKMAAHKAGVQRFHTHAARHYRAVELD